MYVLGSFMAVLQVRREPTLCDVCCVLCAVCCVMWSVRVADTCITTTPSSFPFPLLLPLSSFLLTLLRVLLLTLLPPPPPPGPRDALLRYRTPARHRRLRGRQTHTDPKRRALVGRHFLRCCRRRRAYDYPHVLGLYESRGQAGSQDPFVASEVDAAPGSGMARPPG